eukprot:gene6315-15957_t
MMETLQPSEKKNTLVRAFHVIDEDHSGEIDFTEFSKAIPRYRSVW